MRKRNSWAVLAAVAAAVWQLSSTAEKPGEAACRRLLAQTDATTSILTAELLPATGELPEHCRLEGRILPAVGFEVRLPTE